MAIDGARNGVFARIITGLAAESVKSVTLTSLLPLVIFPGHSARA